jgi:hypothetical protein
MYAAYGGEPSPDLLDPNGNSMGNGTGVTGGYPSASNPVIFEHPCAPLTKILSSGSFYYSMDTPWDLSSRLAVRLARDPGGGSDLSVFDERFVWNEYIVRSLLNFRERLDPQERADLDACQFIVRSYSLCIVVRLTASL